MYPFTGFPHTQHEPARRPGKRISAREGTRISATIESGIREVSSAYTVIESREQAIREAVGGLKDGELLVIAGKGHEDYQILGEKKIHFDDREMARKYLSISR